MSEYTSRTSATPDDSLIHLHAMRHERYAAATALLGESGFATRVGGFNALVRLADEWLADNRTPEEQRLAEAQVIIDTFCACIYAPFLPASRHKDYMRLNREPKKRWDSQKKARFRAEQAEFRAEARFRQTVLDTIHLRVMTRYEGPGPWSRLSFDFSGSVFFYPVSFGRSQWEGRLNLRGCTYYAEADFSGSTYTWYLDCSNSAYYTEADFSGSTYNGGVNASFCSYRGNVDFSDSVYRANASLSYNVYWGEAALNDSIYEGHADLACCTYVGHASLGNCDYRRGADLFLSTYATFADLDRCTYGGRANLSKSVYYGRAWFWHSTYLQEATFGDSIYNDSVDFSDSHFAGPVNLEDSAYLDTTNFQNTIFEEDSPSFARSVYVPENNEHTGYNYGVVRVLTLDELQHLDQLREPRYEIEQELFNVDDATDAKTYRILRRALLEASHPIQKWCLELMAGTL